MLRRASNAAQHWVRGRLWIGHNAEKPLACCKYAMLQIIYISASVLIFGPAVCYLQAKVELYPEITRVVGPHEEAM